jgi:hypothetical protein
MVGPVASAAAAGDIAAPKAAYAEMAAVYRLLAIVVVLYLTLGLAYARATPAWQAPDEPAHFNYVRALAATAQLPVLEPGDYPPGLPIGPQARLTEISAFRYESHQPPLFYALAAVAYKLHPTLLAVRMVSLLLGAALLPVLFICARFVLPGRPWLWLGATAFVAFIPMHLFIAGSANNDSLADLVLSLLLLAYLAVAAGRQSRWRWAMLGLLLGAAMLSKLTIYPAAVLLVAATLVLPFVHGKGARRTIDVRQLVAASATTFAVAAMVSGWWFVRNGLIYGWADMLAQSRQAQVAGIQTHTGAFGLAQFETWVAGSFHSFWGQFGWMSLPLPEWQYLLLLAFTGVVALGWLLRLVRLRAGQASGLAADRMPAPLGAWSAWVGLAIAWLGTTASYLYYNLTFLQTQGRYLFPALAPIGIVCAAGVAAWFPKRAQAGAMIGLSVAMLSFATYVLQRELIPAFK